MAEKTQAPAESTNLQIDLESQRRQVDVENSDLTLGELVRMAVAGELVIAPAYQRKFRWSTSDA